MQGASLHHADVRHYTHQRIVHAHILSGWPVMCWASPNAAVCMLDYPAPATNADWGNNPIALLSYFLLAGAAAEFTLQLQQWVQRPDGCGVSQFG